MYNENSDYVKQTEVDNTIAGKCSGCTNCCQAILTISDKEIQKIKSYIGKEKIKPINRHNLTSTEFIDICPFLNEENKCMIYPVRPEVCKKFMCSEFKKNKVFFNHMDKSIVNMYQVFLPNSYFPSPNLNLLKLNQNYNAEKSKLASKKFKGK